MENAINGRFPATRHSIVAAVQSEDRIERSRALEIVAATYWKPVYKYLRLRWQLSSEDAQDLTQEFFSGLIEKDFLGSYDPGKGRLRTFLRVCADRLFFKQSRDAHRLKRGGANANADLDFEEAEQEFARTAQSKPSTMEDYFYREWVRSVFDQALERVRSKYARNGKAVQLTLFERYDLSEDSASKITYADLAAEFHLTPSEVTNYLHSVRRDFRQSVLDLLREMTATEQEFQAEVQALTGVVGK